MPASIRTIVAGIADAEAEEPLLRAALGWARELRATLHLVHACDPSEVTREAQASPRPAGTAEVSRRDRIRDALETRVRALGADVPVVYDVASGRADRVLLETARTAGAGLIVVGATRKGMISQWLLGTTAQHVVRFASLPVLVVHAAKPHPARRVLLADDLADFGSVVLEGASGLVEALCGVERPRLRRVFVSTREGEEPAAGPETEPWDRGGAELEAFLWQGAMRDLPLDSKVRLGYPAREILAEAQEWSADLLVLGRRHGAGRLSWAGVAEEVIPKAPCDVLVIPLRAARGGEGVAAEVRTDSRAGALVAFAAAGA